jgi:hypothetical protein
MTKRSFINHYYDLFDKQIEDSTLVVWLIWAMIFLAGFLSNSHANYKWNILEYNHFSQENIVSIDWKRYKLIFEELK